MIDARDRLRLIVYGAIQFGLMYGCYMLAFQYLPSHLVAIFSILTPVYVVLIYNFQKARFTLSKTTFYSSGMLAHSCRLKKPLLVS